MNSPSSPSSGCGVFVGPQSHQPTHHARAHATQMTWESPEPEPKTGRTVECPLGCSQFLVVEQQGFNSKRGSNRLRGPLRVPDAQTTEILPNGLFCFLLLFFINFFWHNNNIIFFGILCLRRNILSGPFSRFAFPRRHFSSAATTRCGPWMGPWSSTVSPAYDLTSFSVLLYNYSLSQHAFKFAKWKEGLKWVHKKVGFHTGAFQSWNITNRGSANTPWSFIFLYTRWTGVCGGAKPKQPSIKT